MEMLVHTGSDGNQMQAWLVSLVTKCIDTKANAPLLG